MIRAHQFVYRSGGFRSGATRRCPSRDGRHFRYPPEAESISENGCARPSSVARYVAMMHIDAVRAAAACATRFPSVICRVSVETTLSGRALLGLARVNRLTQVFGLIRGLGRSCKREMAHSSQLQFRQAGYEMEIRSAF